LRGSQVRHSGVSEYSFKVQVGVEEDVEHCFGREFLDEVVREVSEDNEGFG